MAVKGLAALVRMNRRQRREAAGRTLLRIVDRFAFYLVGLIVVLATGKRRQRVGDLAAGTTVARA